MSEGYQIFPVGTIKKRDKDISIEIDEKFRDALLGLEQFSHIIVFFWCHGNDSPDQRNILQVHPKRHKENPLTGVFATCSPVRPNLIAITICKILSVAGTTIQIDAIDAFDDTPVIDIKPYMPKKHLISDARVPAWAK